MGCISDGVEDMCVSCCPKDNGYVEKCDECSRFMDDCCGCAEDDEDEGVNMCNMTKMATHFEKKIRVEPIKLELCFDVPNNEKISVTLDKGDSKRFRELVDEYGSNFQVFSNHEA